MTHWSAPTQEMRGPYSMRSEWTTRGSPAACSIPNISHAYTFARSGAQATSRMVWMEAVAAARRSPRRRRLEAKVLLARTRLHRE
jgi:hypothetical protein